MTSAVSNVTVNSKAVRWGLLKKSRWLLEPEAEKPRAVMAANHAKEGTSMSRWSVVLMLRASLPLAFLVSGGLSWAQGAGPESGGSGPPFDLGDPAIVEEGLHLFRANCTHYCHNPEGRAARAPALRGRDLSAEFIFQRIAKGMPPMPAYGTGLSSEQIWKLVAYVQALGRSKD